MSKKVFLSLRGAKNDLYKAPFYNLPKSLENAITFRLYGKDNKNFKLRESGGLLYVESYTDPFSNITISQPTLSRQPIKEANFVKFDGIDDFLFSTTLGYLTSEVWALASYNLSVSKNFDGIITGNNQPSYGIILNNNNTSIFPGSPFNTQIFVNNSSTNVFLPAFNPKTVGIVNWLSSVVHQQMWVGIDRNFAGREWFGNIYDIILFNRLLTPNERRELDSYLQSTYGVSN